MSQRPDFPILLDPNQLNSYITTSVDQNFPYENLIILDFCQPQMYAAAHIPGAIHVPVGRLNIGTKPAVGLLPKLEDFQSLINTLGIDECSMVVCYDDEGGGWAGRFIWMLDMIGHEHSAYLNGGIRAWLADSLPVERIPRTAQAIDRKITFNNGPSIDKKTLLNNFQQADWVIWDARSPEEFSGERIFALKGGHIPGAVNYEWTRAMDQNNHLKLRPLEEIRSELANLGIVSEKQVITHCQTHHRSGFTYLVAKVLGFKKVLAYPGSWSEWGNASDTPVNTSMNAD